MQSAVNAIRNFRGERRPEDSGEWHSVPLAFRFLSDRAPFPDRRHRAQMIVATLIVYSVHALVAWAAMSHFAVYLTAAFLGPVPGVAIGLLWLAQFEPLRRKRASRIATAWLVSLAVPALALVVWIGIRGGAGVAVCGAVVATLWLLIWYALCLGVATTVHRIAGART